MVMNTLPDAVRPGLRAIAVGINPSLPSVRAGFYFANPRNRFWPALNASRLVDEPLEPGPGAVAVLVERYGIGFTDIVKRPTAGSAELRPGEYRVGAARLDSARPSYRAKRRMVPGRAGMARLRPLRGMASLREGGVGGAGIDDRGRLRLRHSQSESSERRLFVAGARAMVRCACRLSPSSAAPGTRSRVKSPHFFAV